MNNPLAVRARYWSVLLLFAAGALNLFDRQIVNILAQNIKAEFQISDAKLGLLTGTAFGIFYAVLGIPLARLADRVDRVKLIVAALGLWSLFTTLCGFAGSFLQLFLSRVGVGVGEAGSQPASTALISDIVPDEQRTSALSVLLVGAPVGSFLGLLVGGHVGALWGWRRAFVVAGIPGIILGAVMLIAMRDPSGAARRRPRGQGARLIPTLSTLARSRRFRWLAVALTCSTFLIYASGAWLPPFLMRVRGMNMATVGNYVASTVGIGGAVGALGSGAVCDLMRSRVSRIESRLLLLILGVSIPAMLMTLFCSSRALMLLAMCLFNVCAYGWLGPTVRLIQDEAPPESRAVAIGLCTSVASIVSLGIGLPLVGALSDQLKSLAGPKSIGYALALGIAAAALVGIYAHGRVLHAGGNADP